MSRATGLLLLFCVLAGCAEKPCQVFATHDIGRAWLIEKKDCAQVVDVQLRQGPRSSWNEPTQVAP